MKKKLITIFGFIILAGFIFQGVFGVAAAALLCGISGLIIGIYKKDKSIWKLSLLITVIVLLLICLFYFCLINSDM